MSYVSQVRKLVGSHGNGPIFGVRFIKRTTGEIRTMSCRFGVQKGVTGHGQAYDPEQKGLLTVFDMNTQGFRNIPIEGIISIVKGGNKIFVNHELEKRHGQF